MNGRIFKPLRAAADKSSVSNRRAHVRDEGGFGLVEVMVTAVVVLLIATATAATVGGTQRTSAQAQARASSANLAERDQERLRSMRAKDLEGLDQTSTVAQGTQSYSVRSQAELVADAGGTVTSCNSTGAQPQYLRLTSTVTPPKGLRQPAHVERSLYALPVSQYSPYTGTMVVIVNKADGITPQVGVPVTITGPDGGSETHSATTNSLGCAIFQFITAGSWVVTASSPAGKSYLDTSLSTTAVVQKPVAAGSITQAVEPNYDAQGILNVTVDASRADGHADPAHTGTTVTVSNAGLQPSGLITTSSLSIKAHPFTNAYKLYSGTCSANNPEAAPSSLSTYFDDNPGYGKQVVSANGAYNVKLREPPLYVRAQTSGANVAGQAVYLKQTDAACSASPPTYTTTTLGDGTLTRAGYPYGTYAVCSQATITTGTGKKATTATYYQKATIANTRFAGAGTAAAPTGLNVTTASPQGTCLANM